jgi:predicted O-methyltransferase YrrM
MAGAGVRVHMRRARRRAAQRLRSAIGPPARGLARRLGADVVWRTIYSPVPDVPDAGAAIWTQPHRMPGIVLDLDAQLRFIETALAPYLRALPDAFPRGNPWYRTEEAAVLFAMVRHLRPRRVLELGCGHSTLVTTAALEANGSEGQAGTLVAVDPDPRVALPRSARHLACTAQALPLEIFLDLQDRDILFVDTTHTVKLGSEVNRIVLDVLPRLAPGVVVHIHDVFLPYEYPRLFAARGTYLSEQYLLHGFLCENPSYSIVLALHALVRQRAPQLQGLLPELEPDTGPGPSAFWIRRLAAAAS